MNVIYELWDTESLNLVGTYDRLAAALKVVRAAIASNSTACAEALALDCDDEHGRSRTIATGPELVKLATARSSQPPRDGGAVTPAHVAVNSVAAPEAGNAHRRTRARRRSG